MEIKYPIRINKYLAWRKYATRRGADELIEHRLVSINGKLAKLGDKVNEDDKVEVRSGKKKVECKYFAYHKPIGEETGHQSSRTTLDGNLFPVGRLDKKSRGLLILTNDGRLTDRLLNPDYEHEKEYAVTVAQPLRPSFKQHMQAGVPISGYVTKKCRVQIMENDISPEASKKFRITLTEDKKHQIRQMCATLHQDVTDLKRVRIMNIKLGQLAPGQYRPIEGYELETFLGSVGL